MAPVFTDFHLYTVIKFIANTVAYGGGMEKIYVEKKSSYNWKLKS